MVEGQEIVIAISCLTNHCYRKNVKEHVIGAGQLVEKIQKRLFVRVIL